MTCQEVLQGDCGDVLKGYPDATFSAVVTDPPYGLSKDPDIRGVLSAWLAGEAYRPRGRGIAGKEWDAFVPGPEIWRGVLRVMRPGAYAVVFSGTRTHDITVTALRLAGFEIRDQLAWLYGSGFPKSQDAARATGDPAWDGWGTALKPAQEPIVLARKPTNGSLASNLGNHGTGALNIDACRVGETGGTRTVVRGEDRGTGVVHVGYKVGRVTNINKGRWPTNVITGHDAAAAIDAQRDGASRFFYCAKASRSERDRGVEDLAGHARPRANTHPTVKPLDLMRYLVRLVTPPGGRSARSIRRIRFNDLRCQGGRLRRRGRGA